MTPEELADLARLRRARDRIDRPGLTDARRTIDAGNLIRIQELR